MGNCKPSLFTVFAFLTFLHVINGLLALSPCPNLNEPVLAVVKQFGVCRRWTHSWSCFSGLPQGVKLREMFSNVSFS